MQRQIARKMIKRLNVPNMFFKMGIKFEFPVDRYPRILINGKWNTFEYKDWPWLRKKEPFKEFVLELDDPMDLLDKGN